MSNFDKICSVWTDIEGTYKKSGNGLSRLEFLRKMIGSDKSIVHLKSMAMKDTNGDESAELAINEFFSILENARYRLDTVDSIDNLYEFVFGSEEIVEEVNLDDYSLICDDESIVPGTELLKEGYCSSVFKLHDGKVIAKVLSMEDENLIHVEDENAMYLWLMLNSNKITMGGEGFLDKSYYYLAKHLAENKGKKKGYTIAKGVSDNCIKSGVSDCMVKLPDGNKKKLPLNWGLVKLNNVKEEEIVYLS